MKKRFYGWWVVAAAFFTFGLSVGLPYYNISFFYDYFEKTYGWRASRSRWAFRWRASHAVGRSGSGSALQPAEADPGRHRADLHRAVLLRQHGADYLGLLGHLGDLHDGLLPLRPHPAPDHHFALVPQEPREGDGHAVRRRGHSGFLGRDPGQAAHGEAWISTRR